MNNFTIDLDRLSPEQLTELQNLLDKFGSKKTNYKSVTEVLEESENIIEDLQTLARGLSEDELTEQLKEATDAYNNQWDDLMEQADLVEEKLDYLLDFIKIKKIQIKGTSKTPEFKVNFTDFTDIFDKLIKNYKQ